MGAADVEIVGNVLNPDILIDVAVDIVESIGDDGAVFQIIVEPCWSKYGILLEQLHPAMWTKSSII